MDSVLQTLRQLTDELQFVRDELVDAELEMNAKAEEFQDKLSGLFEKVYVAIEATDNDDAIIKPGPSRDVIKMERDPDPDAHSVDSFENIPSPGGETYDDMEPEDPEPLPLLPPLKPVVKKEKKESRPKNYLEEWTSSSEEEAESLMPLARAIPSLTHQPSQNPDLQLDNYTLGLRALAKEEAKLPGRLELLSSTTFKKKVDNRNPQIFHGLKALLSRGRIQREQLLKTFECFCGKNFPSHTTFTAHYNSTSDGNRLKCSECGKTFKKEVGLEDHCKTVHGISLAVSGASYPEKSPEDQFEEKTSEDESDEEMEEEDVGPSSINVSPEKAKQIATLEKKLIFQQRDFCKKFPQACDVSDPGKIHGLGSLVSKGKLMRRALMKHFICICGKRRPSLKSFERHYTKMTRGVFRCHLCKKQCIFKESLEKHLNAKHGLTMNEMGANITKARPIFKKSFREVNSALELEIRTPRGKAEFIRDPINDSEDRPDSGQNKKFSEPGEDDDCNSNSENIPSTAGEMSATEEGNLNAQFKLLSSTFSKRVDRGSTGRYHGLKDLTSTPSLTQDDHRKMFRCICGDGFQTHKEFLIHYSSLTTQGKNKMRCALCGKGFKKKGGLKMHIELTHEKLGYFHTLDPTLPGEHFKNLNISKQVAVLENKLPDQVKKLSGQYPKFQDISLPRSRVHGVSSINSMGDLFRSRLRTIINCFCGMEFPDRKNFTKHYMAMSIYKCHLCKNKKYALPELLEMHYETDHGISKDSKKSMEN